MLADLRDALRQLRKSPGFALTAIVTLALGIGATTAIFTLVHQVMLKSLPVTRPEELWKIGDKDRCCNWGGYDQGEDGDFSLFSWEAYHYFRSHTPEFTDLAALQAGNAEVGIRRAGRSGPPETLNGEYVSGNFFRTFGVQPWIGRMMTDDDDREGAAPVAVLTFRIWQQKFGADRSIVGSAIRINDHPFTVIGVAPPGFYGGKLAGWGMPDIWLPLTTEMLLDGPTSGLKHPSRNFLDLIGRVRPGVSGRTLEPRLRVELHDWLASHVPDMQPGEKALWQQQTLHVVPGGAGVAAMRDDYGDGLTLLLVAAGCVLLVACANLANLMLARGLRDRGQTAVRVALGAPWTRLVRKALVECVALSTIGGVLGIAVAYAGTRLILYLAFHFGGPDHFIPVSAAPSWPVLAFALAVSIATGLLFGIAPSWVAAHADPVEALRGANRSVGGGRGWTQRSLVIGQAALSLVLLSAAALLARSLHNLEHQDFGFETGGRYVAVVNPTLGATKPEQMPMLFRRIVEQMRQVPGVRMASAALYAPMTGDSWNDAIRIQGQPEPGPKDDVGAGWARVTPGFFETLGSRTLLGRTFTDEDTRATRPVAVVNQAFVRRFLKGKSPIGAHFGPGKIAYASRYEIIGVVRDIRYMTYDYNQPVRPMYWLPEDQSVTWDDPMFTGGEIWSHSLYNLVLWAPGNPPGLAQNVRRALASVAPDIAMESLDSYDAILGADFQQQNMIATLTMLFGGLGLLLAAVGLYGVLSYSVEQRTSEIGLRMALGADRGQVVRLVMRGALLQVGVGLAIGIPAAVAAGRLMSGQLFGVRAWDPLMLAAASAVLLAAGLVAALLPARRAAAVDPMVALRSQ